MDAPSRTVDTRRSAGSRTMFLTSIEYRDTIQAY